MDLQKYRNELLIISFLFIFGLVFKIALRNSSLTMWDDVEFTWRVQIGQFYAHSPGYPGYMVIGRGFYLLASALSGLNAAQSMILLSAIFGALLVIPVYLLIRTVLGKRQAIVGSLFVILNPFIAEMSAQAMSDIVSVFFVTLAASLLYFGFSRKNNKIILLSAAICGFSVAVRLTNLLFFPFFIVVAYNYLPQLPSRKKLMALFVSFMAFFGAIAYLPLLFELGFRGFIGFMTMYGSSNAVLYTYDVMIQRLSILGNDLFYSVTPIASVIALVGIYQFILKRRALLRELAVWVLPYLIFFLLYGPADHMNRFILPVYPALALLFTFGMFTVFSKLKILRRIKFKVNIKRWAAFGLILVVFGSIIVFSYPTYSSLEYYSINPYSSKPIAFWINQTLPAKYTIVGGSYCWVLQYYIHVPWPHLVWGNDPSWVTESVNTSLSQDCLAFTVTDELQSCKSISNNFNVTFYAKYDNTLSLDKLLPKT